MLRKYPTRIPIICEPRGDELRPVDAKTKYLVPDDMTMSQFLYVIRKRCSLSADQAIYLFTDTGALVSGTMSISSVYSSHKDVDGFLYLVYARESTFG